MVITPFLFFLPIILLKHEKRIKNVALLSNCNIVETLVKNEEKYGTIGGNGMCKIPKLRFKEFNGAWEENELGNIVEMSKTKYNPLKSEEIYKCVELENLSQETGQLLGYFNSKEQQSIKNKFNKGQVLFGKLRPYLKKYWLAEFDGVCSSEIWVLDGKSVSNNFMYRMVQTDKFNFISNISSGSKMPRADWGYMSEFPFFKPALEEQEKIAYFFSLY